MAFLPEKRRWMQGRPQILVVTNLNACSKVLKEKIAHGHLGEP
jgi:hypothetical protein